MRLKSDFKGNKKKPLSKLRGFLKSIFRETRY